MPDQSLDHCPGAEGDLDGHQGVEQRDPAAAEQGSETPLGQLEPSQTVIGLRNQWHSGANQAVLRTTS